MKRIAALALLAVLGFAVAGCGAAKQSVVSSTGAVRSFRGPGGVVVTRHATIRHATPGMPITCAGGGPTVTVPTGVVDETTAPSGPAPVVDLELSRSRDGTVTVSCTKR